MKKIKRLLSVLLSLALIVAIGVMLLVSLARLNWFFELFTHYAVYYAIAGSILTLFAMLISRWKTALIFGALVSINLAALSPYLTYENEVLERTPDGKTFTILSQNFYYKNQNFSEFESLLSAEDPDIFVIHEAGPQWQNTLGAFADEYPYLDISKETGVNGMIIGSKIPGTFEEIPLGKKFGLLFTSETNDYQILAVHPFAPVTSKYAEGRNEQFSDIEDFVRESTIPIVVVGDFNSTPWSPFFKDLLENADLMDSRMGFGIIPTWHAHNPFFQLPIDFILTTNSLKTLDFHRIAKISADHYGVFAEIKLPD